MRFFAALLMGLFFIFTAQNVLACSCMADDFGPQASKKNIARAKFIVEGRVSFVAPEDEEKSKEFKGLTAFGITVGHMLKGEDLPMLAAYALTKSTCGVSVESLKRQTFFVLYARGEDLVLAASCESYIAPKDRIALMHGNYKP